MEELNSNVKEYIDKLFKSGGDLIDKVLTDEVTWEEAMENPAFRILSKQVTIYGNGLKEAYDSGFRFITGDGEPSPEGMFTEL